ncbi:MAG: UDP-N-acetylmuramate--L-alanine ligase [Ruminococcaceae bacterium]|nr:UDP-N-acetylmuramate--L-alanine ligase [Oscillospiraceae bacterium]
MSYINQYSDIFKNAKHIHFTGIGGVSMSALAMIAKSQGKKVTGSDISESDSVLSLRAHGITVTVGHHADNAIGCDLLVYTAAVKDNNPELVFVKTNNIPHCERAVLLGLLMAQYPHSVAVSGTHGKTTTTSMLSSVFMSAKADPTVLVGANLSLIGGNYRIGGSSYSVYEACEYCNSFHNFFPDAAIVLNVDADHLDFFKDLEDIQRSFIKFTHNINKDGVLIINGDDKNCRIVMESSPVKVISFGLGESNDISAADLSFSGALASFTALQNGKELGRVHMNVGGRHNVLNALSVIAAGLYYGLSFEDIADGIAAFGGADRRFQIKGKVKGAVIVDDYAHHPTEISATIASAKAAGYAPVTVIFQPHTFTRTKALMEEFAASLSKADKVIVTDIFSAREINTIGVKITDLRDRIEGSEYISDFTAIARYITDKAADKGCFILMGAGNVNQIATLLDME